MIALALTLALAAPPRTAVMPLAGGVAISDRAASSLTDALALELQKQGGMEAVLPQATAILLSPLKPREELACRTDACIADLAGAFGAERVVTGEVSWDGGKLVLTLRVLEARSARLLAISEHGFAKGTLNDLLGALPEMAPELLRPAVAATPKAVAAATTSAPAKPIAAAPLPAKPPSPGTLVLHYHRRDGRYGFAGLYTWETTNAGADLRRPVQGPLFHTSSPAGGGRTMTLPPDGKDDFGAYWVVPTDRFRNGRVNFFVQYADNWDECGRMRTGAAAMAQFWILADGAEAWLNVPECELFATREEAERNRHK